MNNQEKPVIIIDGMYFLFRSYHGVPYMAASHGQPTNAVKGFVNAVLKLINRYDPEHMVVVFDSIEPTFRHQLSPDYKANRVGTGLRSPTKQLPAIRSWLQAMGIRYLIEPGIEGDDMMATLAVEASELGHRVIVASGDKDICQLVNSSIVVEDPFRDVVWDEARVLTDFGVRPDQIADYLALMGDTIDNIKGIPRMGDKSAARLLTEYQTIDGIIKNIDEIGGKLGESIKEHQGILKLNIQLTTVVTNMSLSLNFKHIKKREPDIDRLQMIYSQLEFKQNLDKLGLPAHPLYEAWHAMKIRCYDVYHPQWTYFGGRGIQMHQRWKFSFTNFVNDIGKRPDGYLLKRKNPKGHFCPDNCIWAPHPNT